MGGGVTPHFHLSSFTLRFHTDLQLTPFNSPLSLSLDINYTCVFLRRALLLRGTRDDTAYEIAVRMHYPEVAAILREAKRLTELE